MKKRIIALLCLLVMAFGLVATGCQGKVVAYKRGTPVQVNKVTWRGIDEDEFFISAYVGPQDFYPAVGYSLPSLITDEIYSKLAEAGINNIWEPFFRAESETASRALTLAAKYGITYMLPHSMINFEVENSNTNGEFIELPTAEALAAETDALLEKYENIAGFHLRDEPTSNLFSKLTEAVQTIEDAREITGDANLQPGINAFPAVGWNQLSNGTNPDLTYQDYLNGICETGIDYLMFDAYPFTNVPGEIQGTWLNLLGRINKTAESYNLPWMVWLQCGGHLPAFSTSHRVVNEGELNWNAGSALAFGCKGVGYYTGVTPHFWAMEDESYVNNDSLLNKYGTKTPFYYYAKKINAQIQAMAPVLLNAAHEGVILDNQDSPNVYTGDDLLESYRCFKGFSGDSALIGCFDYEGTVALVVMNNSIENHHAVVTLEFDNNYEYEVTQRTQKDTVSGKEFSLHLEAGEFALVVVQ